MTKRTVRALGNTLGSITVLYLVVLWAIVWNPLKLQIVVPGGGHTALFTMLLSMVAGFFAGLRSRRAWWVVAGAAVFTFVYLGFVVKSGLWY